MSFCLFNADIFGISDHNLMYTQEAVEETAEESNNAVTDQAIEARVRFCVYRKIPVISPLVIGPSYWKQKKYIRL